MATDAKMLGKTIADLKRKHGRLIADAAMNSSSQPPNVDKEVDAMWTEFASAILDHIKLNLEIEFLGDVVNPVVAGSVTVPPAVAGSLTTTTVKGRSILIK